MATASTGGGGVGAITGPPILSGKGSPEGAVSAQVGSLYRRTDAGEFYLKSSGTGNTGWVEFGDAIDNAIADAIAGIPPIPPADIFLAYKSADQTGVVAGTWTKVTFATTSLNQGNKYSAVNSRWTPTAGPVQIEATLYFTVNTGTVYVAIYKNGTMFKQRGPGTNSINISVVSNANGTDYYECYGYGTVANGISGDITLSWFQGFGI